VLKVSKVRHRIFPWGRETTAGGGAAFGKIWIVTQYSPNGVVQKNQSKPC
jgi:hypothetical protein